MDLRKRGKLFKFTSERMGFPQNFFFFFLGGGGGVVPTLQETMVNHILRMILISHCVAINYVVLYLIFTLLIFIDAIKTVTLFITYTLCNNFMFIFNLEKVQL